MNKLIIEKDGVAVLQGKICPFRNPLVLPSPTIAGQLIIENIPCTSSCPHLKWFTENVKGADSLHLVMENYIQMTCGCEIIIDKVEIDFRGDIEDREKSKQKKSNIIL
jgi:hypothetical protein